MKDLLLSQIALSLPNPETKTLFISLKAIIHTTDQHPVLTGQYDFSLVSQNNQKTLHVAFRPGLREFLQAAKKARFQIVTFSKMKHNILEILNIIDPTKQIITHRIYHSYCVEAGKEMPDMDLNLTGRMMHRCVIINHNSDLNVKPWCNTIKLNAFTGKADDRELWGLIRFFEVERNFEDVRHLLHVCSEEPPLPGLPLPPTTRKTLFLDMDETLIYSRLPLYAKKPEHYDFVTNFSYIIKRPGVDELLQMATDHDYEIVIFTAAGQIYASPVIDKLDPDGLITHRLYMESCKRNKHGDPVKDLSSTGRSLDRCLIVDDNWHRVSQRENVIRIKPFKGDMQDTELTRLLQYFSIEGRYENLKDAVCHMNERVMI